MQRVYDISKNDTKLISMLGKIDNNSDKSDTALLTTTIHRLWESIGFSVDGALLELADEIATPKERRKLKQNLVILVQNDSNISPDDFEDAIVGAVGIKIIHVIAARIRNELISVMKHCHSIQKNNNSEMLASSTRISKKTKKKRNNKRKPQVAQEAKTGVDYPGLYDTGIVKLDEAGSMVPVRIFEALHLKYPKGDLHSESAK